MSVSAFPKITGVSLVGSSITLTVGDGGQYATIQAAIDAITDSSASKPYEVRVMAGSYAPFDFSNKNYISVRGSGRASIINTYAITSSAGQVHVSGSHNVLSDFQINFVDGTGGRAVNMYAVRNRANFDNFILENNFFDILVQDTLRTAPVYAYGANSNYSKADADANGFGEIVRNNVVVTDCSGFAVAAPNSSDYFNNTIILTTRNTSSYTSGLDHIGVNILGATRMFWHTGRITSGYGANNVWDDTGNLYAFNVASTSAGAKLNIQSIQGIIRNDSPSATGDIHYVHIPATVDQAFECRIFNGFRGQVERDPGNSTSDLKAIYTERVPWDDANFPGRVYWQAGAFVAGCSLQISGMAYNLTNAADGWTAEQREIRMGGDWFCDTSTAAFTINLPTKAVSNNAKMNQLTIYNTDFGGSNNLTVDSAATFDVEGTGAAETDVTITPGTSKTFFSKTDGNYWVK